MTPKLRPWHVILGLQVFAVAFFVAYVSSQPILPQSGLQQIDALTLHEKVTGLNTVNHQPTIVVVTGLLSSNKCRRQADYFITRYGHNGGIESRFGVLLLSEGGTLKLPIYSPNVGLQADSGGMLAAALALKPAAQSCQSGYAIVDADGYVRYRTFDPAYERHAQEQNILLESLDATMLGGMSGNSSQPVRMNHEN